MFNFYPYTDFHEMNLDAVIAMIKKLTGEMHDFKVVNKITFFGDWDITKQYPAWSIVNVGLADGYISIRPVPVGVNYTDTNYWVHVANYSALYADMQNRIVALETTVGDASGGLVKDVDDLKNTVGDASSGLVKDVNDLDERVDSLTHKIGVVIGDSYTTHDPMSGGVTYPRNLGEKLVDIGALDEVYSFGINGTRYTLTSPSCFNDQIDTAAADASFDNDDVDFVIIEGGQNERFEVTFANDNGFYTTLEANVRVTVQNAKTKFPNAKIVIVPLAWNGKMGDHRAFMYDSIWDAIYEVAANEGCLHDPTSVYWGNDIDLTYGTDNMHPTDATLLKYAYRIKNIMNGVSHNFYGGFNRCYSLDYPNIVIKGELSDGCLNVHATCQGATNAIAAGTPIGYIYPGFAGRVYPVDTIGTVNGTPARFKIVTDATYTGTLSCDVAIAPGDKFNVDLSIIL